MRQETGSSGGRAPGAGRPGRSGHPGAHDRLPSV